MRILAIGTATLDIIDLLDRYPREDEKVRVLGRRRVAGGNAVNTLLVLSRLGYACGWGGVVADDPDSRHILGTLQRYDVDVSGSVCCREGKTPTSHICLSRSTGSRTIAHFRDLPEYSAEDFGRIDLGAWDWVHFEGRNTAELVQMQARLKSQRPELICSLEVEKPRPGIESLCPGSDVLVVSQAYAHACGYQDGAALLEALRPHTGSAILFCPWGASGAFAMDRMGHIYTSPAFPPPTVIDTLGAGDVFNAAVIDGILQKRPVEQVLVDACRLAGRKCGMQGLDDITASTDDSRHPA